MTGDWLPVNDSVEFSKFFSPPAEPGVYLKEIIRRNPFFAFSYNALAIPLAVSGFLNPLIAVFTMLVSSLTVIVNASRLSRTERF